MRVLLAAALTGALSAACSPDAPSAANKVPFLVAADAGLYQKHGLEVRQFITPGAAEDARR